MIINVITKTYNCCCLQLLFRFMQDISLSLVLMSWCLVLMKSVVRKRAFTRMYLLTYSIALTQEKMGVEQNMKLK